MSDVQTATQVAETTKPQARFESLVVFRCSALEYHDKEELLKALPEGAHIEDNWGSTPLTGTTLEAVKALLVQYHLDEVVIQKHRILEKAKILRRNSEEVPLFSGAIIISDEGRFQKSVHLVKGLKEFEANGISRVKKTGEMKPECWVECRESADIIWYSVVDLVQKAEGVYKPLVVFKHSSYRVGKDGKLVVTHQKDARQFAGFVPGRFANRIDIKMDFFSILRNFRVTEQDVIEDETTDDDKTSGKEQTNEA